MDEMTLRLRRLFRYLKVGIVAPDLLRKVTVGRSADIRRLRNQLSEVEAGRSESVFVEGAYGRGKSHFLKTIESIALDAGFATCWVTLDGYSHALNHPTRYFGSLLENLRVPDSDVRGLSSNVRRWLQGSEADRLRLWTKGSDSWLSYSIAACDRKLGSIEDWSWIKGWIDGRDISRSAGKGWFERIGRRIAQLSDLLRAMGYKGLVILFDELETVATLLTTVRQRYLSYEFLNLLVDGRRHPYCFFAFGATPDFDVMVDMDRTHIGYYSDTYADGCRFIEKWGQGAVSRLVLRPLRNDDVTELCLNLRSCHEQAYTWAAKERITDEGIADLVATCNARGLSVRETVRTFVHVLEVAEQNRDASIQIG